jgi:putative transposase
MRMARPLRIEYPGALYHVTARGNERKTLFVDDLDRQTMLAKLAVSVSRYETRVYAYVLMSNHYHLLVETPRGNLSRFLQHLNTAYILYFNRAYQRRGHVLEGRFQAKLVDANDYLLALTRYIHLNPVKLKKLRSLSIPEKIACLRTYRWSSYPGYAGLGERDDFVHYQPLVALVGEGRKKPEAAYREFVETGIVKNDAELQQALKISSKAVGGEQFCRWVEEEHATRTAKMGTPAEIAMRRREAAIKPEAVLEAVAEVYGVSVEDIRTRRGRLTIG